MPKVLLTGATRRAGTAAINALCKEGFTVIGTDDRKFPFNMHSKYTKPYYKHASFKDNQFYEDILNLIKKEEPDVLLPLLGNNYISLHKEEIKNYTDVLIPDYESFSSAFSKKKMNEICRKAGISVPQRFSYCEAISLLNFNKNSMLVIKPDFDEGGATGLRYVKTEQELEEAKLNIQNKYGDYVIEEFIPGSSSMRAVQLLFSKDNKIAAYFILKKIHQWPITGGVTVCAVSTNERELVDFVLPFFKICPWEGPVEVELIIDERDKKPKIIEINPRFAGSLLFVIKSGVNFPYIACAEALEQKNYGALPSFEAGILYINITHYIRAVLKEFFHAKNKIASLQKVFKYLIRKKITTLPEKKDIFIYLAGTYLIVRSKMGHLFAKVFK